MAETASAVLPDRGVVSVGGADAGKLLQGLISSDLDTLRAPGDACHAALLTPQGKILFAFFVIRAADGFLLETGRPEAPALAKRLTFYRLRAAVSIEDVSAAWQVVVGAPEVDLPSGVAGAIRFVDPRDAHLGWRALVPAGSAEVATGEAAAAYHARRIARGVPEAGLDYDLGDAFPHEANLDLFCGVDFDKGCFVGQEVVARMQHKTVVRKRIVKVAASVPLPATRPDIVAGPATIGRLGSVAGTNGLAMIRLDRAVEMLDKSETLQADGIALTIDGAALSAYRAATTAKEGVP